MQKYIKTLKEEIKKYEKNKNNYEEGGIINQEKNQLEKEIFLLKWNTTNLESEKIHIDNENLLLNTKLSELNNEINSIKYEGKN